MNTTHIVTIPPQLLIMAGSSPAFVAQFALFIAVVLSWTLCGGKFFKKFFKLPVIAGQIISGIILGPSIINIASWLSFVQPFIFFEHATGITYTCASYDMMLFAALLISSAFTVSYLLWLAGHETDIHDIASVGSVALMAGVLGAFLPILMIAMPLYYCFGGSWSAIQSVGMGLIFAATSVSIPVAMLIAYNKMHLKSSKAALGAAIVDDIVAVVLLSFFSLAAQAGFFGSFEGHGLAEHGVSISGAMGAMIGSIIVMCSVGYYMLRPLLIWLTRMHLFHFIAPIAHITIFFYFVFAEQWGGLAGITGAYFAGFFHRMGDARHIAQKAIAPYVNSFLLPLFLGSIGLQLDMRILSLFDWCLVVVLLIIAIISKLVGCWIAAAITNFWSSGKSDAYHWSLLDIYLFGSSMVARGEVGLVVSTILFGSGIIASHQYVIAVVVIVLTTVVTPIMLAFGFERIALVSVKGVHVLNVGLFPIIGAEQMFAVIRSWFERSKVYQISIEEGKHGHVEMWVNGHDVTLSLRPDEGIVFEGDKQQIDAIIHNLKESLMDDLGRF